MHACKQASKVKTLCKRRSSLSLNDLNAYVSLPFDFDAPEGLPKYRNPIHTSVISRRVKLKGKILTDDEEVDPDLIPEETFADEVPDLIVAGQSNVFVPGSERDGRFDLSPFHVEGLSSGRSVWVPGIAFGIGLCSLLFAIDWIQLRRMPWEQIIVDGIRGSQPKP